MKHAYAAIDGGHPRHPSGTCNPGDLQLLIASCFATMSRQNDNQEGLDTHEIATYCPKSKRK